MCLFPKLIWNPKYKMNKKNGGEIPPMKDKRVKYVPIGCGNCIQCRKQKAREWQIRLREEVREKKNGKFITFTLSDESIIELTKKYNLEKKEGYYYDNAVATKAVRLWAENWRKKYKKYPRYWLITELGQNNTERIHIHGIVFTDEKISTIAKSWLWGHIYPSDDTTKNWVNEQTVNYIIKYVTKVDEKHKHYKPKIFASKGIGKNYTKTEQFKRHYYDGADTITTYTTGTGHKIALPIYYRNKAFTEEEREKLWLHMLDKNERWVMGERVDVSTTEGYNRYLGLLKIWQAKNYEMGFMGDELDWEQRKYENQLRELKKAERLKKASKVGKSKKK